MLESSKSNEIVRLTTVANSVQAHIYKQALAAEGIRCQVVGDLLDAGLGDVPGMRAEVWVYRDDLARAEEILRRGQEVSEEQAGMKQTPSDRTGDQVSGSQSA